MQQAEPLLSVYKSPVDGVAVVERGILAVQDIAGPLSSEQRHLGVQALATACWQALLAGQFLALQGQALPDFGAIVPHLLASELCFKGPSEQLFLRDSSLVAVLAAHHISQFPTLNSEHLQIWLDRGCESYLDALVAELLRADRLSDATFVVQWLLAGEAPLESELLTSRLQALRCLATLEMKTQGSTPGIVWRSTLSSVFAAWRPATAPSLWSAVIHGLGSVIATQGEASKACVQVLTELFRGQLEGMVNEGPEAIPRAKLCQDLLGALLFSPDGNAGGLLLAQYVEPDFRMRALVQSQLLYRASGPAVCKLLDDNRGVAISDAAVGAWIEARIYAGEDEGVYAEISELLQSESEVLRQRGAELATLCGQSLANLAYPLGNGLFDESEGVAVQCAVALKELSNLSDSHQERLALELENNPCKLSLLLVKATLSGCDRALLGTFYDQLHNRLEDEDSDWEDCQRLIDFLGRGILQSQDAREVLLEQLNGASTKLAVLVVAEQSMKALWTLEDAKPWHRLHTEKWRKRMVSRSLDLLEQVDEDWRFLCLSIAAYGVRGKGLRVSSALLLALGTADDDVMAQLLPAVGAAQIPGAGVLKYLEEGLCHNDLAVVQGACDGLANYADGFVAGDNFFEERPELIERLLGWMKVDDQGVSEAAAAALYRLSRQRVM